jgi:simple sugar transport system ATP-binding protein
MQEFDVRGDVDAPVRSLSGGNQQKLVVGRELERAPKLFVVENPTRGLDIRATQAVHARLRAAAAEGAGVIVYSSDLDEVLALASRMVVMHAGRLTATPNDRAVVGRAMLGVV